MIRAPRTYGLNRPLGRLALVGAISALLSLQVYAADTSDVDGKLSGEEQLRNANLRDAQEVRRLLTLGLDVNVRIDGVPLIVAVAGVGDPEVVHLLIERGADVDAQGFRENLPQEASEQGLAGITPAVSATLGGRVETVRYLVEAGADVNPLTELGTALTLASTLGHSEIVEILLAAGADVHAKHKGLPAIFWAVGRGHVDAVKLLIAAGAYEPYKKPMNMGGVTLRSMAAEHPEVAKLLQSVTASQ